MKIEEALLLVNNRSHSNSTAYLGVRRLHVHLYGFTTVDVLGRSKQPSSETRRVKPGSKLLGALLHRSLAA